MKKIEKLEIIRNNLTKKENNELYKLEIINSHISKKTQDLAYTLQGRKELKMHIHELLELNVITTSTSRHRSVTFIINNHNEQKEEKIER